MGSSAGLIGAERISRYIWLLFSLTLTFNQMKTETEVIAPSLIITNNPLLIFQVTTICLNYSEVTEVYHDHTIIG